MQDLDPKYAKQREYYNEIKNVLLKNNVNGVKRTRKNLLKTIVGIEKIMPMLLKHVPKRITKQTKMVLSKNTEKRMLKR